MKYALFALTCLGLSSKVCAADAAATRAIIEDNLEGNVNRGEPEEAPYVHFGV